MRTKDLIKDTLNRLLEEHSCDDLSVKMVCKEAGISKQTLYNHYYSLMDALEDSCKSEFSKALQNCSTYHNWVEGFKCFLCNLHERKCTIFHLYFSSRRDEFLKVISKYVEQLVKKGIEDCSRDIEVTCSEKDKRFMLNFYMYVFMGIVEDFIVDRMNESPEYIVSRCDAMMRYHIRTTLRNIQDMSKGLL